MSKFYAHGGHVGADNRKRDALRHRSAVQHEPAHHNSPAHLRYFAEEIRRMGQGGDKILAHINPHEAMQLGILNGGDINPRTGLPQFGLFGGDDDDEEGGFWNTFKNFLPAIGGLVGSMVFPPIAPALLPASLATLGGAAVGGALGGTLGGALKNPEAPFQGTLQGLGAGVGGHLIGPALGFGAKTAAPVVGGSVGRSAAFNALMRSAQAPGTAGLFGGIGGNMTPYLAANALSSLGGGKRGPAPQRQQQQPQMAQFPGVQRPQQPQQPGLMDKFGQGLRGFGSKIMENPLQSALLGTALYGTIHEGIRAQKHKEKTPHQLMNEMNPYGPEHYRRSRKARRKVLRPGDEGYDPENRYYEDVNPETEYYARGGRVEHAGYIDGDSGGQDDDVKATLAPDDYIMDATTVSLAGDGNSIAGAKRIKHQIEDKFAKGGISRNYPHSHHMKAIDARLSPGEYRIPNHVVKEIGKGNPKEGAKVLDKMRNNLRKHKGVKKFLPPKSKPLTAYMR